MNGLIAEFRRDLAYWTTVSAMIREGSWAVPQVRAVACALATSSPDEALNILEGVREFEQGEITTDA